MDSLIIFLIEHASNLRDLLLIPLSIFGLYLLWSRTKSVKKSAEAAEAQASVAEFVRVSDAVDKVIAQLKDNDLLTRVYAIGKLKRLTKEIGKIEQKYTLYEIMIDTLTRFVREKWPRCGDGTLDLPKEAEQGEDNESSGQVPDDKNTAIRALGDRTEEELKWHKSECEYLELMNTNLSAVYLARLNLYMADFSYANLRGAFFQETDLKEAYFIESDLTEANLTEANLEEAVCTNASFKKAKLYGANLQGAKLDGANLKGAELQGIKPEGSKEIPSANLQGASLIGSNLEGANLKGTNLEFADLSKANIKGADLSGTNVSKAQLSLAYSNEKTKLP